MDVGDWVKEWMWMGGWGGWVDKSHWCGSLEMELMDGMGFILDR